MTEDDTALAARIARGHDYPLARSIGFRIITLDSTAGIAECGFLAGEEHLNAIGTIHGGVIVTLLDTAMTIAALGASRHSVMLPTLELKTSFLQAALPGPLTGFGRMRRLGKSVAFLEGELRNAAGDVLAVASATARVLPRK